MEVKMYETGGDEVLFGLYAASGDKKQRKDIPRLSKALNKMLGVEEGGVLPFFVVTEDYDEKDRSFRLFVGTHREAEGLEICVLPAGAYACVGVEAPRFSFLWGAAMGKVKRWFFGEWLPGAGVRAGRVSFEKHEASPDGGPVRVSFVCAVERDTVG